MATCMFCGRPLSSEGAACAHCNATGSNEAGPGTSASGASVPGESRYQQQAKKVALVSGGWLLLLIVVSGRFYQLHGIEPFLWILTWLVVVPIGSGATLVALRGASSAPWMDAFAGWIERRAIASEQSEGRFNRFVTRPSVWCHDLLHEAAQKIEAPDLRNGATLAVQVFAVMLFIFLVYVAIGIVMFVLVLWFVAFMINHFGPGDSTGSVRAPRVPRAVRRRAPARSAFA